MLKKSSTILIAIVSLAFICKAQPGALDTTFNTGTGANIVVQTTSIQSDGKIIIGGNFTSYNGVLKNRIARLNTDGTLDTLFNSGVGANGYVYSSSVLNNDKIIICGDFTSYNGISRNRIARLNSDGTLDNTFNPGTGANSWIYSNSIQSDGKIIICGEFTVFNGDSVNYMARLNLDGTLDTSFNSGANDFVYTASIQSDGKLIVGGMFTSYDSIAQNYLVRINSDGTLDTSFASALNLNFWVHGSKIENNDKIIIIGGFTNINGISRQYIARLNTDGTLDLSFDPGSGPNGYIYSISLQNDGEIIIGGSFNIIDGYWKRYVARLHTNGSLDLQFNYWANFNGNIYSTSIQSDGKIIIGGNFFTSNGLILHRIARLQNDTYVSIINHSDSPSNINLFPNPTNGFINMNGSDLSGSVLSLYNFIGQLLFIKNINNDINYSLDLSKQPTGIYFIEVKQLGGSNYYKVIKE